MLIRELNMVAVVNQPEWAMQRLQNQPQRPNRFAEQPAPNAGAQPVVPLQGIQPLTGLNLSSRNKGEIWKLYKQQRNNYETVAQLNAQTEEYGIALFLYSIGPQAVITYNGFDLS